MMLLVILVYAYKVYKGITEEKNLLEDLLQNTKSHEYVIQRTV